MVYVQYGSGAEAPDGWINFDASPTLRLERIPVLGRLAVRNGKRLFPASVHFGDIVSGLPIPEDCCDGIYASHVLEHLALSDFDAAIRNTRRHLKPGGIFRLVVPDLRQLVERYTHDDSDLAAVSFIEATGMGTKERPRGLGAIRRWFGNSAHLWLWDERALTMKLSEHGFLHVRRANFGDCADQHFRLVEDERRFQQAVAMECRK